MKKKSPPLKIIFWFFLFLLIVFLIFLFIKFHPKGLILESRPIVNHSPLYEPGDKPMKVFIKAVEIEDGKLFNFPRTIYRSKDRDNQMRQVLLDFFNGPRRGKDQVPVPDGLKLNDFYFTPQGMAVVDISTSDVDPGHFGFYEEVLFIRGLIGTLSQNFYEIKQVKILVDGKEAQTLAGHYALGTAELGGPVVQNVNSF